MTAPRNLSLTEELERIEQAITITLQEIDYNFSKAHRIVTNSILPIVERYGEQSAAVWEASRFWKEFFESSANVSLSGYEDPNKDDQPVVIPDSTLKDEHDETNTGMDISEVSGRYNNNEIPDHSMEVSHDLMQVDDSLMGDNGEVSGSTPRVVPAASMLQQHNTPCTRESPYEALKREMRREEQGDTTEMDEDDDDGDESTVMFEQRTARLWDMKSMTPRGASTPGGGIGSARQKKDPVMHKVLDKTYRIHTTHHKPTPRLSPTKSNKTPTTSRHAWQIDSPMSSPEMAIPTFRSQAFLSPLRTSAKKGFALSSAHKAGAPRTPGLSVQTPMTARTMGALKSGGSALKSARSVKREEEYEIDWESDESDTDLGMSPPKTIQFALPPSKLIQTPAREASRKYVESLLYTAGAEPEGYFDDDQSPSAVRVREDLLEDSL